MAVVKESGVGKSMPKPKIVKPPAPKKISKPQYSGVPQTPFSGVTGGASVSRYGGTPPGTPLSQPWQSGIYGGIPPGVLPHFPTQYSGVPTGFSNITGTASTFLKTMNKPPTYYAPHEPMSTYYPPEKTMNKDLGLDLGTTVEDWSGGGGGWSGGGGGGGGGGTGGGYGFTLGLINWRI